MNDDILRICSILLIFLFVIGSAGCVAPASSGSQSSGSNNPKTGSGSGVSGTDTTPTPEYVTEVTPFGWTPQKTATPVNTTTIPSEEWVTIYATDQEFSSNRTMAVAYQLKNPPMVINLTVTPVNVTKYVEEWKHYGTSSETKTNTSVSVYHPSSYFIVTVRDKSTGRVLLQDGYSASNNEGRYFPIDTTRTMKVYSTGDLLIEMNGQWIKKANVTMSVKKVGNIDNITAT